MTDCGLDPRMTCVSMGNPHVVMYCENVAAVPLATIGPLLETQPIFPKRINVHFVQVHSPAEVTMRTWERGSGHYARLRHRRKRRLRRRRARPAAPPRRFSAHLPGGDLELEWADERSRLHDRPRRRSLFRPMVTTSTSSNTNIAPSPLAALSEVWGGDLGFR